MNESSNSKPVDTATTDENLPEVARVPQEMVPYAQASAQERAEIDALMAEIDLRDGNSVLFFGSKAQQELTGISDRMLEGVKNKDVGRAGDALNEMVAVVRGFEVQELDPARKPGLLARLFGKAKPLAKFLQRYELVRKQIDRIGDELEDHKTQLLRDITSLDRLYDANLEYLHGLERYIAAGEEKLRDLDANVLPAIREEVERGDDMLKAQELRDLHSARDDLERRVHDLRLTRQVTLQALPSLRLVQENDKGLVNKISSTLVNTVPLWRQQLAQTVTIWRSHQAGQTIKEATDLTNELLEANAENLQQANREVREQLERGVFDVGTIQKANAALIATIEESLDIAEEGRRKRAEAVEQLNEAENELREALASASSRSRASE